MRKTLLVASALALVAPMLSGCQLARVFGFNRHDTPAAKPDPQSYGEEQLALGKQRLDSGQYGGAIEAFSNARVFEAQEGAAYNGMAIAYAQLGRPDLAERFFKQAIMADAANPRYQANLARFYATVAEADVPKTREQAPALAVAAPEPQPVLAGAAPVSIMAQTASPAVTVQPQATRMARVSATEVLISAPPASTALAPAPDGRRRAAGFVATNAPVRRVNPQYPVKLSFAPVRTAPVATGNGYPVRIGLAQTANASTRGVTTIYARRK